MKVFISVDIEGITTTTNWEECNDKLEIYKKHAEQMTKETVAACEGAIAAGVDEIVIKDAHGSGRNIDISQLPENVKVIRSWSGHPYSMVEGIDNTFDAVLFVGYHSRAGSGDNPLSHTMSGKPLYIKINGECASEFMIYSYAAAKENVPTVFLSGDKGLCEDAMKNYSKLVTVAVKEGNGSATMCLAPKKSLKNIRESVEKSLKQDLSSINIKIPDKFEVEICFKEHVYANKVSYYPGISKVSSNILKFESDDYFEVLRMISFIS